MLAQDYGGVVKHQGIFGVSIQQGGRVPSPTSLIKTELQSKHLYVVDPGVLHRIFVKDKNGYELSNLLVK